MKILNTDVQMVLSEMGISVLMTSLFFALIFVILMVMTDGNFLPVFLFVSSCLIFFTFITLSLLEVPPVVEEQTEIKVTINETVSFREIYDNYKIVEHEGEIFTLIERETE